MENKRALFIRNSVAAFLTALFCILLIPTQNAKAADLPTTEEWDVVDSGDVPTVGLQYTVYRHKEYDANYAAVISGTQTTIMPVAVAGVTVTNSLLEDYSGIDVYLNYNANGISQRYMFANWDTVGQFICGPDLDLNGVTDLSYMFQSCSGSNFKSINVAAMDTSKVTSMTNMFFGCSSLESIDMSSNDLSKVINMDNMFQNCNYLKTVNFGDTDMTSVRNINAMFSNDSKLESVKFGICVDTVANNGDSIPLKCSCQNAKIKFLDISNWSAQTPANWNPESIKLGSLMKCVESVKLPNLIAEGVSIDLKKTFYDREDNDSEHTAVDWYCQGKVLCSTPGREPEPETNDEPGESDDTPEAATGAALVVWTNGKKEAKTLTLTLTTTLAATTWTDSKGKSKQGKLVWVARKEQTEPAVDSKHKLTTKTDCKTIATVSSKGVVTAKGSGTVYIYAVDTGSKDYEEFVVNVKVAAKKILVTESAELSTPVKKFAMSVSDEKVLYIVPKADSAGVDGDATFTAEVAKDEFKSYMNIGKPTVTDGVIAVTVDAIGLKDGKVTTAKFNVINDQSGKKGSVSVQIYNSVSDVTGKADKALAAKGDTAVITLTVSTPGGTVPTTDKAKVYVSPTAPTVNGTKVTAGKSSEVKATLAKDGKTIELSASKDITAEVGIYVVYTNTVTKTAQCFKVGTVTVP